MKFLAVFFFAGLGLAAAVPFFVHDGVDVYNELEEKHVAFADDDPKTELGKKLKEHFDEILQKFKDALEKGKGIKEEYIEQLKEIRQNLKDLKVELGEHTKELIEKLKERVKEYWQKILEKLKPDKVAFYAEEDPKTELARKLKKHFEEILEKVTTIVDNGKTLKEDLLLKLKEIRQKLQDMKIDIGEHAKELLGKLKDKIKDYWKRIFDKLNPASADEDDEVKNDLRKRFVEILEKIRDAIKNHRFIGLYDINKLREVFEKCIEMKISLGDKAKELLEQMRKDASGWVKSVLDYISKNWPSSNDSLIRSVNPEDLGNKFHEMIEKIRQAFKDRKLLGGGFISKLKELREQMRQNDIPIGGKTKEIIEKLKEKSSIFWRRILDRLSGNNKRSVEDFTSFSDATGAEELQNKFHDMLEKIKEAIKDRKLLGGGFISKLRELRENMRNNNVPIGEKTKEMIEKLKEKTTGFWRRVLDRLSGNNKRSIDEFDDILSRSTEAEELQNQLHDLLEQIKEAINKGNILIGGGFQTKLKELREKMRNNNIPIGEKAKEMINEMKEKANLFWKKILERILGNNKRSIDEKEDEKNEVIKKLKDRFEELLEKFKDAIQKGKEVKKETIEKLKEIRQTLKDFNVDLGNRAKLLIERLKEEAKDYWKKILDTLKE